MGDVVPFQQKLWPSEVGACASCPFNSRKCGSRGNPEARLVFVAEAPGDKELVKGRPLVGPSGKVFWGTLERWLKLYGLDPEHDVYILNSMQCRPPRTKNQVENQKNVERGAMACRSRLLEQIMRHPRDMIVAMGNSATRSITGNQNYKITQVRGQLMPSG